MRRKIRLPALLKDLSAGRIVPLAAGNWIELAAAFPVVERIATGLAGDILLVRWPAAADRRAAGWALIEAPDPNERVVRPLADEKTARALIADRLAAYDRMWDG